MKTHYYYPYKIYSMYCVKAVWVRLLTCDSMYILYVYVLYAAKQLRCIYELAVVKAVLFESSDVAVK